MKTIGDYLKEARIKKGLSVTEIGEITKIKKSFIEAIEKNKWTSLPDFAAVVGFVKSIAQTLELDEKQAVAFLKRDYPPKKTASFPKLEIREKFTWNPRLTFLLGISLVSILVLGYMIFQYKKFSSPPFLQIESPKEGEVIQQTPVTVRGKVDANATLWINNQPGLVEENGDFSVDIEVGSDTKEIVVVARSRSGKETVIRRTIKPELK